MATANDIIATLTAVGRAADVRQANALEGELRVYGELERVISARWNDASHDALTFALSYREALAEVAHPEVLVKRLRREAADIDYRAERAMAEAADFAGRAAFRRNQGESELALQFQKRADACTRVGEALSEESSAKSAQAAAIEARLASKAEFAEVLGEAIGLTRVLAAAE